jgi:hypothetical protein
MLLAASFAFAFDTKKIATQDIFLDDGQRKSFPKSVEFGVVGNVRPARPGEAEATKRVAAKGAAAALAVDVSKTIQEGRTAVLVLMGNLVPGSSLAAWKAFSRAWLSVIAGGEPSEEGYPRTRVLPVAGEDDGAGDDRYTGFGAAFPGVGADIGFNRVATWYAVDLEVDGHVWRLLTLDSNKAALGSRWEEQTAYVDRVVAEDNYDSLIVFMYHPVLTLAVGQKSNDGEAPLELLEIVDNQSKVGALKAVFSSRSTTNEVFLPRGKFGELYVTAGGGGAPVDTPERWGHAEAGGFKDLKLETTYDFAILREFEKQAEARKCSAVALDHAKSAESWAGFPGAYEASCMPLVGWWDVTLAGERMSLSYRQLQPDNSFKGIYTADFAGRKAGWAIGK